MITLVTYPPAFGQPSGSPFCVKAEYLLNLSGLPWVRQDTADPRKWPKGKLPAIIVDDEVIGDSDNIRQWIEEQGEDLDKGLKDLDRATSRAFIRMAEEHMYFHLLLDRWADNAVWPLVRDVYFAIIPKFIRGPVTRRLRRRLLDGMQAHGLGRPTAGERLERLEPDLSAITSHLWQGPFLFGDHPSAADASVAAMLGAMAGTPGGTQLSRRIKSDLILTSYVERVAKALG